MERLCQDGAWVTIASFAGEGYLPGNCFAVLDDLLDWFCPNRFLTDRIEPTALKGDKGTKMESIEITPLNVGKVQFDLSEIYHLPADHELAGVVAHLPVFSYHISLPGRSVLVDAADFDPKAMHKSFLVPGYVQPPTLLQQMDSLGIAAEEVTDVVITHAHYDHFGALTKEVDGCLQPTFPSARHYLNVADWQPERFEERDQRTLGVVEQSSLLTFVEGSVDLQDGLSILPLPGETPGHQILHLSQSEGPGCYFAGDLYHHQLEFVDTRWNVIWADTTMMKASKETLMRRAGADGGFVYFTHMTGPYFVELAESAAGTVRSWQGGTR